MYVSLEIFNMTQKEMMNSVKFAPPPPATRGFIRNSVTMFISRTKFPTTVHLLPHRDNGAGALVFACGTQGSRTEIAMCAPSLKEDIPSALNSALGENNTVASDEVHYATLQTKGDFVNMPARWCHTVTSTGTRICVSYFGQTFDKKIVKIVD